MTEWRRKINKNITAREVGKKRNETKEMMAAGRKRGLKANGNKWLEGEDKGQKNMNRDWKK